MSLGIGMVHLSLFEAGRRLLKISFGLFDGCFRPGHARALFAVVEGGPTPRPWRPGRPTSARRSTRMPETLNPTLDVTRASTVPRPKTCTATSRPATEICTSIGLRNSAHALTPAATTAAITTASQRIRLRCTETCRSATPTRLRCCEPSTSRGVSLIADFGVSSINIPFGRDGRHV